MPNQFIADSVSVIVVDLLEVIEINEQKRDVRVPAAGMRQCLRTPIPEERAVGQTGKRVNLERASSPIERTLCVLRRCMRVQRGHGEQLTGLENLVGAHCRKVPRRRLDSPEQSLHKRLQVATRSVVRRRAPLIISRRDRRLIRVHRCGVGARRR